MASPDPVAVCAVADVAPDGAEMVGVFAVPVEAAASGVGLPVLVTVASFAVPLELAAVAVGEVVPELDPVALFATAVPVAAPASCCFCAPGATPTAVTASMDSSVRDVDPSDESNSAAPVLVATCDVAVVAARLSRLTVSQIVVLVPADCDKDANWNCPPVEMDESVCEYVAVPGREPVHAQNEIVVP